MQSRVRSAAVCRQPCVAAERAPGYAAGPPPAAVLDAAVAKIREGLAELAAVDAVACDGDALGDAILAVSTAASQLIAQEGRLLTVFDAQRGYRADACVRADGWLRHKTTMGPGAAKRRVRRARLLERMPLLRAAFQAGDVRVEHVDAVAYRATATRMAAVAEHDATLTALATRAEPRAVAVAVQRIVDHIDADGTDDPKPCDTEHLRGLNLHDGFAGLAELTGTTTAVLAELLRRTRDLYDQPDPADTPDDRRRTPSQRFHDALQAALQVALDNHPGAPIGGVKTHIALFVDLFTLLGADQLATLKPRLTSGQGIDPELARHIAATTNPTMRAILGLGPWNPVTVGRVRALPDSLRLASHLGHRHCRAPGCDLPAVLCDIDHNTPHSKGGETKLCNCAPMCRPHNLLKHEDGWTVVFNTDTGEVTWTSADGTKIIKLPPPDI
jgi:hypothetical protein